MRVGLIDVDGHKWPNVALMKLSSWNKSKGDIVEWWWTDMVHYDVVYMSKIFSDEYTKDAPVPTNADVVIRRGTGYAIDVENGLEVYHKERDGDLDQEIENMIPDYSIYPGLSKDTAYGFLTRGCPRGCPFCHVANKEGKKSCQVAELTDFWRGQNKIQIMDPNIMACKDREHLLWDLERSRAYVDFNQGIDVRLCDKDVAEQLGRIRVKRLHFAWDNPKEDLTAHFEKFARQYRRKDPAGKSVYVLTNFNSTMEENLWRIETLRSLGFDPFVMIYRKPSAPQEIRDLQRWCNNKFIFKSCKWEEYDRKKG